MSFPDRDYLLDIIKGSVTTLVLFLAFVTLPMIGMIPGLFAPLPAAFYSLKRDWRAGAAIVLISVVVLASIAEIPTLLLYLLQSGCLSLTLPFFLRKGKGAAGSLAYSVALCLALVVVCGAVYAATQGINLDRQVVKGIEASIAQTATFYAKAGVKGDELRAMEQGLTQAGSLIGRVYPAMMIISLIVMAGANMLVLARLYSRLPALPPIGTFRSFRNPEPLVWGLIAAGFAMLVPNEGVARIALNVLVVIIFMYLMQGLAIVTHLFGRLAVPRFVRAIFYVLLVLQPYLAIGVAVVGIFDIWGDFRTPKQRNL